MKRRLEEFLYALLESKPWAEFIVWLIIMALIYGAVIIYETGK